MSDRNSESPIDQFIDLYRESCPVEQYAIPKKVTEYALDLLHRLTPAWTELDRSKLSDLEGGAWPILCRAGLAEVRFTVKARTDESQLAFEATACGGNYDERWKQNLHQTVQRSIPAWSNKEVVVDIEPVICIRLTGRGECEKPRIARDFPLFVQLVDCPPRVPRLAVRIIGDVGRPPGASATGEGPTVDDASHLAPARLAELFGVAVDSLRTRLNRWRKTNLTGWIENPEHGPREPKYLYCVGAVRPIIKALTATSQMTSERPAKKN